MATIKDIANLAGVSRGTVDRVLNNRGDVNPQTAQKVMDIVQALNYKPNKAGLALAAQKKKTKIGIILFSESNPFFDAVSEGVEIRAAELADYGLTTITRRVDVDEMSQLNAINELVSNGIQGLIIAPFNSVSIKTRISEITKQGIPVVTVNTDIEDTPRLAYVGSDYYRGGCIAAGLFSMLLPDNSTIGIITGSENVLCHSERIRGFKDTIIKNAPHIKFTDVIEAHDDEFLSHSLTSELLNSHPEVNAVYFAAGGVFGGCKAIEESGKDLKVITYDEIPTTLEYLKKRIITATISQRAPRQGYTSLGLLFDYLTSGILPKDGLAYVEHSIKLPESYD